MTLHSVVSLVGMKGLKLSSVLSDVCCIPAASLSMSLVRSVHRVKTDLPSVSRLFSGAVIENAIDTMEYAKEKGEFVFRCFGFVGEPFETKMVLRDREKDRQRRGAPRTRAAADFPHHSGVDRSCCCCVAVAVGRC
jgi:hypothetical protein